MFNKVWIGRAVTCLLTVAILVGSFPTLAITDEDLPQSAPPNIKQCVVYNYDRGDAGLTPTMYMWGVQDTATYRVYASQWSDTVLGSAAPQVQGSCCVIPLDAGQVRETAGSLYVTRQAENEAESERMAVKCPVAATPSVSFEVREARPQSNGLITQSVGTRVARPNMLQSGKYYVVSVSLSNFTYIQSLALPIKYDPNVLELEKLTPSTVNGVSGYKFDGAVSTDAGGDYLKQFMTPSTITTYTIGGNPGYGIGTYEGLGKWGATQSLNASSGWRQTPYVNTETGLIKLEFSTDNPVDFQYATSSDSAQIVRLFFKCKEKPTETTADWTDAETLHFASVADVPDDVTQLEEQQRYYFTTSPSGCTAAIQSMDIMAPPLFVSTDNLYALGTAYLTAEQIYKLPRSYASADDQIRTLIENQVKVYNYTNTDLGNGIRPLDYQVDDVLILTPSNTANGAAKQGDLISVYTGDGSDMKLIGGPSAVSGDGGVAINLGTEHLNPAGGNVYVSVTRGGKESAKIAVEYDGETSRDVYFKLYSSGVPEGTDGIAVDREFAVKRGDQIRLDLCFNHFDDLLSYTFRLGFNQDVLQAADSSFHTLIADGYISEKSVSRKEACLAVGTDMTGITVNDALIYTTWNSYQENETTQAEVEEVMCALGIGSWDELEQLVEDIKVKYSFNDSAHWNGGLLFTGPVREPGTNSPTDPGRTEDTLYPYVDNDNGTLRLASATLVNPPLVLEREGDGYHFLSVYFVAVASGKANFSISGASANRSPDGSEVVRPNDQTDIILSGPGMSYNTSSAATVCAMPFTAHWQAYAMDEVKKEATIKLLEGNATTEDTDPSALFLYPGFAFRDPGFVLQTEDDIVLVNTAEGICNASVSRYIRDSTGGKIPLPDWSSEEAIYDLFEIPAGSYSASYDLVYEYEYTDSSGALKTVTAERKVYVICRQGDLNGDGQINLFDEQMLVDGDADGISDPLYLSKTYVDQTKLHAHLMGGEELREDYIMPVARSPDEEGPGSAEDDTFRLYLEFYSPDGTKLDPLALPAGEDVILTVRGKNLIALQKNGLLNLGIRLSYDSSHFTLNGFESGEMKNVLTWNDDAVSINDRWISDSLSDTAMYTSDASDCQSGENNREIYIQYINELGIDWPIFAEQTDDICLAAFSFKVAKAAFEDVDFCWLDYAVTTADGVTYNRFQLLDGTTPFQKPEDISTASILSAGYSITGEVVSYNAKNPIYYELYRMGGDGEYEATPTYTGIAVEGEDATTASKQTQRLTISNVLEGKYKLLIKKQVHLTVTIVGLEVSGNDVNLMDSSFPVEIQSVDMAVGDVDGNGAINVSDINIVARPRNYNNSDVETADNPETDIDGNGAINVSDRNIISRPENYNKVMEGFIYELH